jgi:two-component sensor histidine kinase
MVLTIVDDDCDIVDKTLVLAHTYNNSRYATRQVDRQVLSYAAALRKSCFDKKLESREQFSEDDHQRAIRAFVEASEEAKRTLEAKIGKEKAAIVADTIMYHCERYDGTGPFHMKGEEIPPEAFILNMACLLSNKERGRSRPPDDIAFLGGIQYPSEMVVAVSMADLLEEVECGRMAKFLMHEIKNLLMPVICLYETIPDAKKDDVERLCREGRESAARIKELSETFMKLGKDQPMETTNIHSIIENSLTLGSYSLKKRKVKIRREYHAGSKYVYCSPLKLEHAFLNIIHNATEAVDTNGTIEIRTYSRPGNVNIDFRDNGKGTEDPASIFTGKSSKEGGHGLGMLFCSQVIAEHRGTIYAESEIGKGTTISITLPIVETRSQEADSFTTGLEGLLK